LEEGGEPDGGPGEAAAEHEGDEGEFEGDGGPADDLWEGREMGGGPEIEGVCEAGAGPVVEELAGVPVGVKGFVESGAEVEEGELPADEAEVAAGGEDEEESGEGFVVAVVGAGAEDGEEEGGAGDEGGETEAAGEEDGEGAEDEDGLDGPLEEHRGEFIEAGEEGEKGCLDLARVPGEEDGEGEKTAQEDGLRWQFEAGEAEGLG